MTNPDLEAIEARCQQATPGPWSVDERDMFIFAADGNMVASSEPSEGWVIRGHGAEASGQRPPGSQDANGVFIAHAREDIPKLIAALRSERDARKRLADIARCVVPPKPGYVVSQAAWTMLQREL